MNKAGWWRKKCALWIDLILAIITVGIYGIIMFVKFFQGKQSLGKKVVGIEYSNPEKQINLFCFFLFDFLFCLLIIPFIIRFIMICMKRGTWAEKWADNYLILQTQGL